MRMTARLMVGLLLLVSLTTASASDGVRERLADAPVLRGEFEQRKQLQGFRNPLKSSGNFLLARERGVLWQTRQPFASLTVLTRERLLTRMPDGSTRILLDAEASPALSAINSLLLALVSGDLDALTEQFESTETLLAEGTWQLVLTPREPGLMRVIGRVELSGGHYVQRIVIEEGSGDRTEISFTQITKTPSQLSEEEARQF